MAEAAGHYDSYDPLLHGADGGRALSACLVYLRDRIGVPRDMSQPAAMNLRAHLNALIALC